LPSGKTGLSNKSVSMDCQVDLTDWLSDARHEQRKAVMSR